MELRSKNAMLSFVFLILNSSINSATYLISHADAKLDLPSLAQFQTESAITCIHRCLVHGHDFCNVVNVKEISIYQVECIFAHLGNGDKLKRHLKKREGWVAYEFLVMDTKKTATATISIVPTSLSTKSAASPAPIACKSGGSNFNLKHARNGQYLGYDTNKERLITKQNPSTDDTFCELQSTGYLYMVSRKKCLHRITANSRVETTLSNDCTSVEAYFWHDSNGIIKYHNTKCLRTSNLEQPQLGTTPYLTTECTYEANSGLLYTKS